MSCSKPGINAAGRSLYGGLGAGHNEFHRTQAEIAEQLGEGGASRASVDDVEDMLVRMRLSAHHAATEGQLTAGQQATITKHLATGWSAVRAGDIPRVREIEALSTMHQRYAPDASPEQRLRAAEERMRKTQVALGLQTLHQSTSGDTHVRAAAAAHRAEAKRELARARAMMPTATTPPPATTSGGQQEHCPSCGQWMAAEGHTCPVPEGLPPADYSAARGDDRTQQMLEDLETSVQAIVESGQLTRWLAAMASNGLNRWSLNNRLLAVVQLLQRGEDLQELHLMGFRQWEKLNRQVRKGEKAVWILAPITRKIREEGDDGRVAERVIVSGFKSVPVFNVTQTDGDPLPSPPTKPAPGEATPGTLAGLRTRVGATGYEYEEQQIPGCRPATGDGTLGYTDPASKQIVVDARLSDAQKASTIAHELGHVHCGHVEEDHAAYRRHRGRMETEAEMTAYMVNRARGMSRGHADSFSPGYIAGWARGDTKVIRGAMERATKAFNKIMDGSWPS